MPTDSKAYKDILRVLEESYEELNITKTVFSCILKVALRHIIRTLPKSINPTGHIYSMMDDISRKHPGGSNIHRFLRLLTYVLKRVDKEIAAEGFTQEVVMKLVEMTRTEDLEERKRLSELLASISDYPGCLNTIFFGVANEFINFIDNNRTHIGLEEVLKVVLVVIKKRNIAYEDMAVFHYQVILRMIRTRFCGESKEISNVIKAICRNYPGLIPLTIKHFKRVFGEVWSNTKVVIVHAIGEALNVMSDEMYLCLENEICELVRMSFDSNHHLVTEDMAETLLSNYRSVLRHKETFVPKVFESVYKASQKFWRIEGVRKILRILHAILEMDCRLFERCLKTYNVKKWRGRRMEKRE